MGIISEIFNFDDIGKKIKNLAKWSCWITILLIWIAAPIAFFVLLEHEAELCLIPLVGAVVGPLFVWIGSWAMYAFGEFVEDIHAIRDKEGTTKEVNAKREAEKKIKREAELKEQQEAVARAKREAELKAQREVRRKGPNKLAIILFLSFIIFGIIAGIGDASASFFDIGIGGDDDGFLDFFVWFIVSGTVGAFFLL